ncbi:MAG: aspartate--ammonia ligase [Candidatus Marinimicrobia bacterium]|nr:aspartate--ammonia ligase [Candidatus Neomarinimicrobiota bacterium]
MLDQDSKKVKFSNDEMWIPENYSSVLNLKETENAIDFIKEYFRKNLAKSLNLSRVSAPIMVMQDTGINDHLNGIERPVDFPILEMNDKKAEIVQSLAKWKRLALADYNFEIGEGLYTNMNAIRPDEHLDKFHSLYVDQWDWERIISEDERNGDFLRDIAKKIYNVIYETDKYICEKYSTLPKTFIPKDIFFITTEELEEKYPELTSEEREHKICKEHGAVFLIGIGGNLKSGKPHDGRAADYDDWSTEYSKGFHGLNGDILIWNELLNTSMELSSMGIRVDKKALQKQLKIRNEEWKKELYFHKRLLNDELPLCIGGGIGQSRLCMLMMRKAHIGEVHSAIWTDEIRKICKDNNIFLL